MAKAWLRTVFYEPPHQVGHGGILSGWATRPDASGFGHHGQGDGHSRGPVRGLDGDNADDLLGRVLSS